MISVGAPVFRLTNCSAARSTGSRSASPQPQLLGRVPVGHVPARLRVRVGQLAGRVEAERGRRVEQGGRLRVHQRGVVRRHRVGQDLQLRPPPAAGLVRPDRVGESLP